MSVPNWQTEVDELHQFFEVIVGEYIEVHELARSDDGSERSNRRRTTVVLDIDPAMPHGVRWRHAHETFLPDSARR